MRENRKKMGATKSIKLMKGKFQKEVDERIEAAVNKKAGIRNENKKIADLKRARRIREKANIDIDFIKLNSEKTEMWAYETEHKKQHFREVSQERAVTAKMVREIEAAKDYRKKFLSLSKWDFLRQERRKKEEMIDERLRQRRQMNKILILASTYDLIKIVRQKFEVRRAEIRQQKLMDNCATKLQKNYRNAMHRYAKDPKSRQRLMIKDFITLHNESAKDFLKKRASNVIHKFLIAKQERNVL